MYIYFLLRSSLKLKIGSSSLHTKKLSYRKLFVIVKLGGDVEGFKKVNGAIILKIEITVVLNKLRFIVVFRNKLGLFIQVSK